jgi:hypothetical protein
VKTQPSEWKKKVFASYSSDREQVSRVYEELEKLNTNRENNPINKLANELKRHYPKNHN